jgi:hypothetical protein
MSFLEKIGRSGVFPMREQARYTGECDGNQQKRLPVDGPAAFLKPYG